MQNYEFFTHKNTKLNTFFSKHYFSERKNRISPHIKKERYIENLSLKNILKLTENQMDKMIQNPSEYLFSFYVDKSNEEKAYIMVALNNVSDAHEHTHEMVIMTSLISNNNAPRFLGFGTNRFFIENIYLNDLLLDNKISEILKKSTLVYNRMSNVMELNSYTPTLESPIFLIKKHIMYLIDMFNENFSIMDNIDFTLSKSQLIDICILLDKNNNSVSKLKSLHQPDSTPYTPIASLDNKEIKVVHISPSNRSKLKIVKKNKKI